MLNNQKGHGIAYRQRVQKFLARIEAVGRSPNPDDQELIVSGTFFRCGNTSGSTEVEAIGMMSIKLRQFIIFLF